MQRHFSGTSMTSPSQSFLSEGGEYSTTPAKVRFNEKAGHESRPDRNHFGHPRAV